MASRTPAAAFETLITPLNRAVACVTFAQIQHNFRRRSGEECWVALNRGDPLPVRGSRISFELVLQERFFVVRDDRAAERLFRTVRRGYQYAVRVGDGPEILAFHWHPQADSNDDPHLHLSSGAGVLIQELQRAHIPTGRISAIDFVRMLIEQFGIRPLRRDCPRCWTSAHQTSRARISASSTSRPGVLVSPPCTPIHR